MGWPDDNENYELKLRNSRLGNPLDTPLSAIYGYDYTLKFQRRDPKVSYLVCTQWGQLKLDIEFFHMDDYNPIGPRYKNAVDPAITVACLYAAGSGDLDSREGYGKFDVEPINQALHALWQIHVIQNAPPRPE